METPRQTSSDIDTIVDAAIGEYNGTPLRVTFAEVAGTLTVREMLETEKILSERLGARVTIGRTEHSLKILMDSRNEADDSASSSAA